MDNITYIRMYGGIRGTKFARYFEEQQRLLLSYAVKESNDLSRANDKRIIELKKLPHNRKKMRWS